ncbi:hypothetical protein NDU88_001081 [Pleurodeles waltl]|uniref:Uncharacterized protein n=1 Tax=Pleurodeles waltl TaxID=8319 RepID=A0AAV7U687_PLEWA|nr:hypothetical protein NDU88_001081 [Pleurodeles waltl]
MHEPSCRSVFPNTRAADRCRSVDQSAPGRPRNFNFISLWRAAEAQSIAPSQAGHGKIIQHLPVRSDKKVMVFCLYFMNIMAIAFHGGASAKQYDMLMQWK